MTGKTTTPRYLGSSRDDRTNRWSIECPACGHKFEPPTTMISHQYLTCPNKKCGKDLLVGYDDKYVRVLEDDG